MAILRAIRRHSAGAGVAMLLVATLASAEEAPASDPFVVRRVSVLAMAPAFGQVDSADAVSARTRVAGSIVELRVREGDVVTRGDVIAVVADARVPLQAEAEAAQAAALETQLEQARADLARVERLHADGVAPTQRLDQQRALTTALEDQLRAARSQRAVTLETGAQGEVRAPVSGRVLRAPLRAGAVVLPGEEVALIGSSYIVTLRLPERRAATLSVGATVEVETTGSDRRTGRVVRILPALEDGRLEAEIETEGLEAQVFGARLRVWAPAGAREAVVAPAAYLDTRFGVDFARLRAPDGRVVDVVVRRGEPVAVEGVADAVEILSGLAPGDTLAPLAAGPGAEPAR